MDKLKIEAERVAFEAHETACLVAQACYESISVKLERNIIDGEYKNRFLESRWDGWQARASQAPAPSPDVAALCQWLRDNSSGVYRQCADAADLIESLAAPSPASAAKPAGEVLTDHQIAEVAINYGVHAGGDQYDITKYDCAEDFYNCVRACMALAAPISEDTGKGAIPCKFDGYGCGSQGPYCAKCTSCFAPATPSGIAPAASIGEDEVERMTTDEAREYLVKFMEQHFTDTAFHRYIRGQISGSAPLAGDFAWQMARALRILASQSASAKDAVDAERYRYVRDTGTLETAVWEALEGYGCAQEGELDQAAYAHGMDAAIDAARAAMTRAEQ